MVYFCMLNYMQGKNGWDIKIAQARASRLWDTLCVSLPGMGIFSSRL